MRIKFLKNALIIGFLLAPTSCARVSSPDGGPEDETPPKLLSSVPKDQQINYTGKTIVLNFNEFVTTQGIESNLIITPKIKSSFKSRVKKRKVTLTFNEPWAENTTYNINFGNTIQDLNNKNIPPNLNLSFSTGNYIDSLQISGTITNLYSKEPVENALVSLYTATDTLNITTGAASYYARTDTSGIYQFKNLPNGKYLIYAAADKNNNQKADVEKESYGFNTDTLHLTQNLSRIDFDLQRLNTKPLKVKKARHIGKYFDLTFNKAITEFSLITHDSLAYRQYEPNKIRFYNKLKTFNDTIPVIFSANDSINSNLQDTVKLYFNESKVKQDPFDFQIEPEVNAVIPQTNLKLTFNKPVGSYNRDSLIVEIDSLNRFSLPDSVFTWNNTRTETQWSFNLKDYIRADKRLKILFKKGAFISIENDSTKNKVKGFSLLKTEDSGIINGSVNTDAPNFIVQLLSTRSLKVIDSKINEKNFSFQFLNAGSYLVKVIFDLNGNGVWDIGNILSRTQAEPIVYYVDSFTKTKFIEIRKNWTMDDINISYQVNKGSQK